jgi:hypothetical protein
MTLAADRAIAVYRDSEIVAVAGALGVLGLVALVLTPVARSTLVAAAEPHASSADAGSAAAELPLTADPAASAPWVRVPAADAQDLTPLAVACDGLARLADGDTLPAALEAVRPALDARGVAVWLADSDRRRLHVVAAAGYDRRVVERFPAIDRHDHNPTSRAYASGVPATMPAAAGQPAAIAVPITGARGTTGVLSAELADGVDASPEVLARARIIAAQLASLLEPATPDASDAGDPPAARAEHG